MAFSPCDYKEMKQFYKVARPNGFDFRTGNTVNYRINIGKTISNPEKTKSKKLCSADVIHASEFFFDALYYGEIPCSIFLVEGKPVSKQSDKAGFKELKIVKEISTANWQNAFYSFMIWMLKDLKNNFDCKIHKNATDAVNQAIQVFVNAQKTGKIDVSAAKSARSAAESAISAEVAARSVLSATRSAAEAIARFAWHVVRSVAWSAISAEAVALSVLFATRSAAEAAARSAWYVAISARYVAEYAARSAEYAADSAEYAARSAEYAARSAKSAKKKEFSDKFTGLLEANAL